MASPRKVYVVDADDAQRGELVAFHQAKGLAPRAFSSVENFLEEARCLKPGCVILGKLTQEAAPRVLEAISENPAPLPVVLIAVAETVALTVKSMKRPLQEMFELPFDPSIAFEVLNWLFEDLEEGYPLTNEIVEAGKLANRLTNREREVLRGLVGGLSNKAIAAHLDLKTRTIEMHRTNMMRRLNVQTLSAALRIAFYAKIQPLKLEDDRSRTIVLVPTA